MCSPRHSFVSSSFSQPLRYLRRLHIFLHPPSISLPAVAPLQVPISLFFFSFASPNTLHCLGFVQPIKEKYHKRTNEAVLPQIKVFETRHCHYSIKFDYPKEISMFHVQDQKSYRIYHKKMFHVSSHTTTLFRNRAEKLAPQRKNIKHLLRKRMDQAPQTSLSLLATDSSTEYCAQIRIKYQPVRFSAVRRSTYLLVGLNFVRT